MSQASRFYSSCAYLFAALLWLSAAMLMPPQAMAAGCKEITEISLSSLPPGAREVIEKIKSGSRDFAFPGKDGVTFGNREGCLPADGNYQEYTVVTKKMKQALDKGQIPNRGEERIVYDKKGKIYYYTQNHYKSFKRVK